MERLDGARVLIYSHDTFGLGHLRRARAIAHALVEGFKGLSVLILSGSPIIGRFEFRSRVDFVRIPGVIKLHDGDYTSLGLHVDIEQTLSMRESIIRHTAEAFAPDLFLVDKEPQGLRREVLPTLECLARKGVPLVLGLRDVLDAPEALAREWAHKGALEALDYYDQIWVYGDESMGNPLEGLPISQQVRSRLRYLGYLRRYRPLSGRSRLLDDLPRPFLLVTPGGGGDGVELVDSVLAAYESGDSLPWHGLFMLGPFMPQVQQDAFRARAAKLPQVTLASFDSQFESLMAEAAAVVAMGGYNTFCELISFDKPSLLVPRTEPREEQLVRALKAEQLGLVQVQDPRDGGNGERMRASLARLVQQPPPSVALPPGFMRGLDSLSEAFLELLPPARRLGTPVP